MQAREKPLTVRQAQILDCTMELLREDGLAALTVRRVAGRVGFSEAALYRHYSGKDALLVGLLERVGERLLSRLGELAGDANRPVRLRVEDCIRHHLEVVLEAEGLPVLLLAEGAVYGDSLARRVRRIVRGYFEIMEPLVAQLPEPAGSDLTTRERVLMLMGLPAIAAVLCRAFPSALSRSRLTNEVVQVWVARLVGALPAEDTDA